MRQLASSLTIAMCTRASPASARRTSSGDAATVHGTVAHDFADRGVADVEVRADSWVAFNGRSRQRWIDPSIDLSTVSRFAPAADYVLPLDPAMR